MSDLGKCNVCGKEAGIVYPLLPNSPAFCSKHDNPEGAGQFGADFTGPDDFDIPLPWDDPITPEEYFRKHPIKTKSMREHFVWTDKEGDKHLLTEIDDQYLQNIINYLKRKIETTPDDYGPGPFGEGGSTELIIEQWEHIIALLVEEQKHRKKHHIVVEDKP